MLRSVAPPDEVFWMPSVDRRIDVEIVAARPHEVSDCPPWFLSAHSGTKPIPKKVEFGAHFTGAIIHKVDARLDSDRRRDEPQKRVFDADCRASCKSQRGAQMNALSGWPMAKGSAMESLMAELGRWPLNRP